MTRHVNSFAVKPLVSHVWLAEGSMGLCVFASIARQDSVISIPSNTIFQARLRYASFCGNEGGESVVVDGRKMMEFVPRIEL